jgi:copper transport protein
VFSAQSLATFPYRDSGDDQGDDRIGPRPAEQGVKQQADKQYARQVGAQLALGYPAASINVLVTLDRAGRIADETLTDPRHLVTRRIVYNEHD